jgi:long-subunit fatty acid transport protein
MAYDTSSVSAKDRTADMAIDRQVRYAVGATYTYSDTLDIGTEFEYVDLGSAKIDGKTLIGEYDNNNVYIFAMNFNWKF